MLCRIAWLCALVLPLAGCFSYTSLPGAPGTVVVVPPATAPAATSSQDAAPYVR